MAWIGVWGKVCCQVSQTAWDATWEQREFATTQVMQKETVMQYV